MTGIYPTVSVIIPVKNEALKIRACIDGILQQTVPVHEIIVIDSGSTDGTIDILRDYQNINLIEIPAETFNHGDTRNLGVSRASGEYVLLTVGDARPYNEFWLEELLNGFIDQEVAGVCGKQVIPHEKDKNPMDWYYPISEEGVIRYQFKDNQDFIKLDAIEKKKICGWDDVTAIYKRQVLIQIPFQKTSYCEDAIWAKEAILKGHAIVYNQSAKVFHYHQEDSNFTFKRTFTTLYFRYRYFKHIPVIPTLTLKMRLSILKHLTKRIGDEGFIIILFWYRYNISNIKASIAAHNKFLQALNEETEVYLDILHESLCGKPPIPIK